MAEQEPEIPPPDTGSEGQDNTFQQTEDPSKVVERENEELARTTETDAQKKLSDEALPGTVDEMGKLCSAVKAERQELKDTNNQKTVDELGTDVETAMDHEGQLPCCNPYADLSLAKSLGLGDGSTVPPGQDVRFARAAFNPTTPLADARPGQGQEAPPGPGPSSPEVTTAYAQGTPGPGGTTDYVNMELGYAGPAKPGTDGTPKADAGKPGIDQRGDTTPPPTERNLDRPVDPAKDNPAEVQKRYGEQLDDLVKSGKLSRAEADHMRERFSHYMKNMEGKYSKEDMARICASMNTIMDSDRLDGKSKANTIVDLACKGDNAQDSNGQGGHNTCAPTSLSRILQQKDFAGYAEQMASVASKGGAWVGGENGQPRQWVKVDERNFIPDGESRKAWNEADARNGKRGMCTQLDNAVMGQYMADLAGARDGKEYVYLTANAHLAGAEIGSQPGQSQTGEGLFEKRPDGSLAFKAGCPPATIDIVARANHAVGGGGLYVQENLANKFRDSRGNLPPGMIAFKDAADLRAQIGNRQPPSTEYQIVTNGTMVAGMQGHGLHAQTVRMEGGKLVFGNNWTKEHNHRTYGDDFVNGFTNPQNWGNYRYQQRPDGSPEIGPDGKPIDRDWKKEYMDDDKNRRPDDQKAEQEKEKLKQAKDQERKELEGRLLANHQRWKAERAQAQAKGDDQFKKWLSENPEPSLTV